MLQAIFIVSVLNVKTESISCKVRSRSRVIKLSWLGMEGFSWFFCIYSDRSVARAIRLERERNTRHMSKKGESQIIPAFIL